MQVRQADETLFGLVCGAAYLGFALAYARSAQLAPIALDDLTQLRALRHAPFASVFDHDPFGKLRPIKNALFWIVAQHSQALLPLRASLLGCVLASAALAQRLFGALLGNRGWALLGALCWLANPITLSVLCWLSSANLVICALGCLGYLQLGARVDAAGMRGFAALGCLGVALLSHETAVLAPLSLWMLQRSRARQVRRWFGIASALCALSLLCLHAVRPAALSDYRFAGFPRWQLALNAPRYLFENLRLWLWLPGRFGVLLPDRPGEHLLAAGLAWLGAGALAVGLWRLRLRDPVLCWAGAFAFLWLSPLVNWFPLGNTPVAMHYLYLPGVGLALLMARAAESVSEWLRRRGLLRARWLPAAALALLIAAWLPEQRRVLVAWADAESLYALTLRNYPHNVEARVNLAGRYLELKQYAKAERLLDASLRIAPGEIGLWANRFKLWVDTGRVDAALALLDAHPELKAQEIWLVHAQLLASVGRDREAVEVLRGAFDRAREPELRVIAGYHLVAALARAGQREAAQSLLDRLRAEFPDRPELQFYGPLPRERRHSRIP